VFGVGSQTHRGMTKTRLIEVAEHEDHDTEDIFRNDYASFVEEQLACTNPAGSSKIGLSRQLPSHTFPRRQDSFEGQQTLDSTGLRTMVKWSSTTSLASASTVTSSPNASPGSGCRGEEFSLGRCYSGRASTETTLSCSTSDGSCSFAEWALTAQKKCPGERLEPVAPRPVRRRRLHKLIETPSDEREAQTSSQVRAVSPLQPSTGTPRKHTHWMLKA